MAVLHGVFASITGRVAAVSGVHRRILKLPAAHAVVAAVQNLKHWL
jgi:hypothetical protein